MSRTALKLWLISTAVCACGVPQPSNTPVDAPPNAPRAYELVVDAWDALGAPFPVVGGLPGVRWFEGPCLDYDDPSDRCVLGAWSIDDLTGDSEIHLVLMESIHESSLAHEVLHWALTDDPNHLHSLWLDVPLVNQLLIVEGF